MADSQSRSGLVVLVGAGPGSQSLITLAGFRWLSKADTVVYDRLVGAGLLDLCHRHAKLIYVGKGRGQESAEQEKINQLLVDHCRAGELVVRLKGGDPLVFGRGGEEARALRRAGCEFRIVPGISAAIAAGACAGIPLTDRKLASTAALVTGHEDPAKEVSAINFEALAGIDTVVFYMGVGKLDEIAARLVAAGRAAATPAAVVERAATPRQRTVTATLATIGDKARQAGIKPPALLIVGEVVSLRRTLAWYEQLPLFGQTVMVTRARGQASRLAEKLTTLGAEVIEAPAIAVEPPADLTPVDSALNRIGRFDWLVFTSPNGVEAFVDRCRQLHLDARNLGGVNIAVVGPGTDKALRENFLAADLIPGSYTTEALGEALVARGVGGKRVLLARADIAAPQLAKTLTEAGADLTEIAIYRTVRPDALGQQALEALKAGAVDWITFTSSSTVRNFLDLADGLDLSCVKPAAIGPVTAETLEAHGLKPAVIAEPCTIDALVEAILAFRAG